MRILNLGCGVQSTTIFLMAHEGLIEPVDYAIFADTQEEPPEVYEHLKWLRRVPAPVPIILESTAGRIGDDLSCGVHTTGQRFATIPAYTAPDEVDEKFVDGLRVCFPEPKRRKIGKLRRQCTKEYKTEVVERVIRREVFRLKPRQRFPKGTMIEQLFGISTDEAGRAVRIEKRVAATKWAKARFPLLEKNMSRDDCKQWLKSRVPHETPRSACVFCPYKSAEEWKRTKENPAAWARAVEVDEGLRKPGAICQRGMNQPIYVHRTAIPLAVIDLDAEITKERERKAKVKAKLGRDARERYDLFECGSGMCWN